jgi:hypothetical protein
MSTNFRILLLVSVLFLVQIVGDAFLFAKNTGDRPKIAKTALLREISRANKNTRVSNRKVILDAIEELERSTSSPIVVSSLGGEWSLVFSSQVTDTADAETFVDKISALMYKIFFKVAPFLAGGQESTGSTFVKSTNKQSLDLDRGTVNNTVSLKVSNIFNGVIRVDGLISPVKRNAETNELSLRVTFTDFAIQIGSSLPFVKLPLPRPTGSLVTTFCDNELRVSRGGRGGVFVAKRLK